MGKPTDVSFVDSTPIRVCHIKRGGRNSVFRETANFGKTSIGWFFGFKLHIMINHQGELLAVKLTKANEDDRSVVPEWAQRIVGYLVGDKGYISISLVEKLLKKGVRLIYPPRKNAKKRKLPVPIKEGILLRARGLVETVLGQLKCGHQVEHSRHRSPLNFMANLMSGLVAYCFRPIKPTIRSWGLA